VAESRLDPHGLRDTTRKAAVSILLLAGGIYGGIHATKGAEPVNAGVDLALAIVMLVSTIVLLLTLDCVRALIPIRDAGDHYRIAKPRLGQKRKERDLRRRSVALSAEIHRRLKDIERDFGPQPELPSSDTEHEKHMRLLKARKDWRLAVNEKANQAYQEEWRSEAIRIYDEFRCLGIAGVGFCEVVESDDLSLPAIRRVAEGLLMWPGALGGRR
jgi:hypothetical protein